MAPFPFPQLNDLREKYTYNITPFTAAMATGRKSRTGSGLFSDDDDLDDEDIDNISCFTGILGPQTSPTKVRGKGQQNSEITGSIKDLGSSRRVRELLCNFMMIVRYKTLTKEFP